MLGGPEQVTAADHRGADIELQVAAQLIAVDEADILDQGSGRLVANEADVRLPAAGRRAISRCRVLAALHRKRSRPLRSHCLPW